MFIHKLFRRKPKGKTKDSQVAYVNLSIYDDMVELSMHGDEIRIGGALTTILMRNPQAFRLLSYAVEAAEREFARQQVESVYQQLLTLNPN